MNIRSTAVLSLALLMLTLTTGIAQAQLWDIEIAVDSIPSLVNFQIATNSLTGDVGLVYQQRERRKFSLRFRLRSQETGWGNTELITSARDSFEAYDLAFDPNGGEFGIAYMPWRTGGLTFARRSSSGGWSGETIDPDAYRYYQQVALTFDSGGMPWVVYCTGGGQPDSLTVAHRTDEGWLLPPETLYPECPGRTITISASASDEIGVLFNTDSDADGRSDSVNVSFRSPGAGGWSHEVAIGPSEEPDGVALVFAPDGTPTIMYAWVGGNYRLAWKIGGSWVKETIPWPDGVNEQEYDLWGDPLFTSSGEVLLGVARDSGVQVAHREPSGAWWYEDVLQEDFPHYPNLSTALDPITELPFVGIRKLIYPWNWENSVWLAVPPAIPEFCNSNAACEDGNPCTDDICLETGECSNEPNFDPCDDGNECTIGEACDAQGTCSGATPLSGGEECFGGFCCTGQCVTPECTLDSDCIDSDDCTDDFCDWSGPCSATCQSTPNPDPICSCLPKREVCSADNECCSNKCRGGKCR